MPSPNPPRDPSLAELSRLADRPIRTRERTLPTTGPRKGRYEEVAGPTLREHYRFALRDSSLLDMKEPLAAMDAIIARLMKRLDDLDSPDFRYRAVDMAEELVRAANGGEDAQKQVPYLAGKLHAHLEKGASEDRVLKSLGVQIDRLRRGVVDAWKIKLGRRQSINARDLQSILSLFVDIVRGETTAVVSTRILARIDREVMSNSGASLLAEKKAPREVEVEAEVVPAPSSDA